MSEFRTIKFFNSQNPNIGFPVEEYSLYSDGTPFVKGNIPNSVDSVLVRPANLQQFVMALFLVDSMNERGSKIKNLILPYVPGARQDRINPNGDILFTIKSVAKMINERNFDRVIILDPHSSVTPALIDRCQVFPFEEYGMLFVSKYDGIIAPDAGAVKRAEEFAKLMGVPVYQATKKRNTSTGKLSGFSFVPTNAHQHFLVVDDICDGGGTFVGLGEIIRNSICSADLFVTHGIFTKGTNELFKYYGEIFTTDSRDIHERNKVTKFDVVTRMMESLK